MIRWNQIHSLCQMPCYLMHTYKIAVQDKLNARFKEKKGTMLVKRICLIVPLLLLAAGCSQAPKSGAAPSPNANQDQIKVQQSAPQKLEIKNPQQVAERLENLAVSVPQVESAHCVVFGNTAVVGINVKKDMDRSKVGTVKYSVAEALRKDPYGVNAIVTADMDLDQRLRNIRDNISAGRPVTGFAEQMADIVGRIMPQLPRDLRDVPSNPAPSDANQVGRPNL